MLQTLVMSIPDSFVDEVISGEVPFEYSTSSAVAVLAAIVGSMVTVTGIVFSVMTLTVQQAGASISPRVVRTFYRDGVVKWSLGLFVGTFTYAILMIASIDEKAGPIGMIVGVLLALIAIAMFLYMVNHVGQTLRSSSMMARVADATMASIRRAFPHPYDSDTPDDAPPPIYTGDSLLRHQGSAGVVMALNLAGLSRIARRQGGDLTVLVQVGDPIRTGDPLMGFEKPPSAWVRYRVLNQIAVGEERAIDFDPAFGIRILVDAASKALSPGVNDPTTAVLAVDRLGDLLAELGSRSLETPTGDRLHAPSISWEGVVDLALSEVVHFGAGSVQVTRRLMALMDRLLELPPERAEVIAGRRAELIRVVSAAQPHEVDRAFALFPDPQGITAGPRAHRADEVRG